MFAPLSKGFVKTPSIGENLPLDFTPKTSSKETPVGKVF